MQNGNVGNINPMGITHFAFGGEVYTNDIIDELKIGLKSTEDHSKNNEELLTVGSNDFVLFYCIKLLFQKRSCCNSN